MEAINILKEMFLPRSGSKSSLFHKLESSPDYCELIVTEKCFFRCKMCNMWERKDENSPTLLQWKSFLSSFRKTVNLPFKISICGGETLTYPHLCALITHARKLGFDVSITTNAFLLDKKKCNELYSAGLREIVISIDSFDESTHDKIRGVKGSYSKVMHSIENLTGYSEKISINLLSVIMSLNIDSILPLIEWANGTEQINSINFNAITEPISSNIGDDWYKASSYSYLWPDREKVCHLINSIIGLKDKGYKIGNPYSQLAAYKSYFQKPEVFIKEGSCHMGASVSVNSEGFIFMCSYYGDIGNIKDEVFIESWSSEKSKSIRNSILSCSRNCKMLINCNFKD